MKYRFSKRDELIRVEEPRIGVHYHLAWAYSRGVVGVCIEIDKENKTVKLRSPKTKIEFKNPVKWSELRHTRKNQIKNPH